jgi:predicted AAA+ superfamily ATPase
MKYKPRWLTDVLKQACLDHPVVVLTGARQVGKSTLLMNAQPTSSWRYLSFDDYDVLDFARRDPTGLLKIGEPVVLDEVQRVPDILTAVKRIVDSQREKARFVLSGSANLLLLKQVSESLAGRAVFLKLHPMTWGEENELEAPSLLNEFLSGQFPDAGEFLELPSLPKHVWRGGMPPVLEMSSIQAIVQWLDGYVTTYLERDLRQLSQVESLSDFRRVMVALALRNGQVLNQSELARDVSVPQPTVHRYLNLLEASMLFERVPAFARSLTKRLIKSPKVYFLDSGLTAFLQGIYSPDFVDKTREWGALLESFVLHHLRSWASLQVPEARIYYWRTTTGYEVDFVIERGRNLLALEVKSTTAPRFSDIKGLQLFLEEYPEAKCGVLVYNGNRLFRLTERIFAVPIRLLVSG